MTEQANNTQIFRYLNGEMDPNEQADFEKRLRTDPILNQEYELQAAISAGVKQEFIDEKKQMLHQYEESKKRSPYRKFLKVGLLAASIVLIVSAGFYFLSSYGSMAGHQRLASKAFDPYPNYIYQNTRGLDTNSESQLEKGMRYYTLGNYQASTKILNGVSQKSDSTLYRFYLGNAYLASERPDEAIEEFQNIQNDLDKQLQPYNQWYLALAYLYNQEPDKAKPLLEKLANDNSPRQRSAKSLLKKLNN